MHAAPSPSAHRPSTPAAACALPGKTGWTDEGHDTDRVQFQPTTGTRRVLTLFVDFPDARATGSTEEYAAQLAPAADWMRTASHGRTRLALTSLHRWVRMPAASDTSGFERGLTFEAHEKYVRDAITAADPYTDFSRYDMVYVVPTKAASAISFSPTYLYDPTTSGVTADGARLKWAVTFGQDMWRWGPKVAAHETGHTFGLPDLSCFTGDTHHTSAVGTSWATSPAPHPVPGLALLEARLDPRYPSRLPGRPRSAHRAPDPGGTARRYQDRRTAHRRDDGVRRGVPPGRRQRRACVLHRNSPLQGRLRFPTGEGPVRVMNGNPTARPSPDLHPRRRRYAPTARMPAGCTPLDLAAYTPGQTFTDPDSGVRIDVLAGGRRGDVVRLSMS